MKERLSAAESEEELCRSKEENQRKQKLLDSGINPGPGSNHGLKQKITETSQDQDIKEEEEQLPVSVPEFRVVCVKTEESSLLQTEPKEEETQGKDISTDRVKVREAGKHHNVESPAAMTSKPKGSHYWSDWETAFMLTQLKELDILRCLDGRKRRNGEVFRRVAVELAGAGYIRTAEQIRVRWKHLKRMYYAAKKNDSTSGSSRAWCPHQDILEELLGDHNVSQGTDNGVDVGFETSAMPPESESPSTATPPESECTSPRRTIEPDSGDEAGGTDSQISVLPPRDTSTSNVSAESPTPRKRRGAVALDVFFDRLEVMQRANAARQEAYMERLERRYQENREALMNIVQSSQQMVLLMTQILRAPPAPPAPQQQSVSLQEGRSGPGPDQTD